MLFGERHQPHGVGLAGAVHRTWAVAEKNDCQFSNPRIDTADHHPGKVHSQARSGKDREDSAQCGCWGDAYVGGG